MGFILLASDQKEKMLRGVREAANLGKVNNGGRLNYLLWLDQCLLRIRCGNIASGLSKCPLQGKKLAWEPSRGIWWVDSDQQLSPHPANCLFYFKWDEGEKMGYNEKISCSEIKTG